MPPAKKSPKHTLSEMRDLVLQEMDHIPRWPKAQQSDLRQAYWLLRMNSLGKKAGCPNDRSAVMHKCLDVLAQQRPGVDFNFDRKFFAA